MQQQLNVQAVIFDRDGVIVNSEGITICSVKNAFKKLGFPIPKDEIAQLPGRGPDIFKEYSSKQPGFNYDKFRSIQRKYTMQSLDNVEIFHEIVELIGTLHKRRIPIAVTTSANKEVTLFLLKKCGILKKINVLVTKEDCTNKKPDPEPYILTAKKLEIDPQFCVVLEDTALGVEAAKKAGMFCIAIPNEYTKDQDFTLADAIVKSAKEINSMLRFV